MYLDEALQVCVDVNINLLNIVSMLLRETSSNISKEIFSIEQILYKTEEGKLEEKRLRNNLMIYKHVLLKLGENGVALHKIKEGIQ